MMYMKSQEVQFMMRFWMPRLQSSENTALPLHTVLYKSEQRIGGTQGQYFQSYKVPTNLRL